MSTHQILRPKMKENHAPYARAAKARFVAKKELAWMRAEPQKVNINVDAPTRLTAMHFGLLALNMHACKVR